MSLFVDDMIPCIENPKDNTKKTLEVVNEFSKVAECKINTQKLIAFLYPNNEVTEREIKKIIPFTIPPKKRTLRGAPGWCSQLSL